MVWSILLGIGSVCVLGMTLGIVYQHRRRKEFNRRLENINITLRSVLRKIP